MSTCCTHSRQVLVEQVIPAWSWGPLAGLLAAPVVFADMEMTVRPPGGEYGYDGGHSRPRQGQGLQRERGEGRMSRAAADASG